MNFLTNLNLNKNEIQNVVIQPLAVAPSNPKEGQIYYNSTDKFIYRYTFGGRLVLFISKVAPLVLLLLV